MEYTWCHGPNCHERNTTTRVRGVKGSKVLRTVKIALNSNSNWIRDTQWEYFCDQTCMHDFIKKHITRRGKHDEKSRYGTSKKGVAYYVYYDLDAHGYRTASQSWKVRH